MENHRTGDILHSSFKYYLSTLTILVVIFSATAQTEEYRGEVVKANGEVHIIDAEGKRRRVEESSFIVREMDTIVTAEGGNAIVRFNDGVLSILREKSRLQVEKANWLSHLGGKIYFTFRKVFSERRQVKTRFATLGIRGTTFIIYDDDNGQRVALEEGLLDIESPGPVFEIHKQQALDEFEAFKQKTLQQKNQMRREFDDYKEQVQRDYIEYGTVFTLQPDHVIRFDGTRVDENLFDDNVTAEFEDFEAIAGELLDEFREQARQYREQMESVQMLDEEDF